MYDYDYDIIIGDFRLLAKIKYTTHNDNDDEDIEFYFNLWQIYMRLIKYAHGLIS